MPPFNTKEARKKFTDTRGNLTQFYAVNKKIIYGTVPYTFTIQYEERRRDASIKK